MTTVPKTYLGRLQFFEQRLPHWEEDPASIGLQSEDVAALALRVSAARAAFEEMRAIRIAAEGATQTHRLANDAMFETGMGLVETVKAFARRTGDQSVYPEAGLPAPNPPSPTGPPPMPTNLRVRLLPDGSLRLSWQGSTARGGYFSIYRGLEQEGGTPAAGGGAGIGSASIGSTSAGSTIGGSTIGGLPLIASVAAKAFDDRTIPAGTSTVRYLVQARRGRHTVESMVMVVPFGGGRGAARAMRAA